MVERIHQGGRQLRIRQRDRRAAAEERRHQPQATAVETKITVVRYPVHRDLRLDGRGLRLVPSFFCRGTPVALADPELPPTLVYPLDHSSHWELPGAKSLPDLLGHTR